MAKRSIRHVASRTEVIEGQTTRAELVVLVRLASEVPSDQVIVEVGSYRGRSSVALGLGSKRGNGVRVYAIDPHTTVVTADGGQYGPSDMAAMYRAIERFGLGEIIAVVACPSLVVCQGWQQPIGLLFLDGNHETDAVGSDFNGWWSHVAMGGILVFHDRTLPSVKRFLDGLEKRADLTQVGTERKLVWFKKRGAD